jgi:hypothetical protein
VSPQGGWTTERILFSIRFVTPPGSIREEILRAATTALSEGRGAASAWRIDVRLPAGAADVRRALPEARRAVAEEHPGVRWKLRALPTTPGEPISVSVRPLGAGVRLQDRDRDMLAFLAMARALTTAQVEALVFPGKHRSVAHRRLRGLAVGPGRLVRDAYFVDAEAARIQVWGLTAPGYDVAERVLGKTPPPRAELVRPQFLQHLVWLNELLVALATAGAAPARPQDLGFRWICDTDQPLTYRSRDKHGFPTESNVAPDAILELPREHRRVFIEAERGTHTIAPVSVHKSGATVAKVRRYRSFFTNLTSVEGPGTPHTEHFGDGYAPGLLVIAHSRDRCDRVWKAIYPIVKDNLERGQFSVEVLTMAEAKERYVPRIRHTRGAAATDMDSRRPQGVDVGTIVAGFNALFRHARAAQAAGVALTPENMAAVQRLREELLVLERGATSGQPSRPASPRDRTPAPASRGPHSA